MIDLTIDGNPVDPRHLELFHHGNPLPGTSRYTLRVIDSELADVLVREFPDTASKALSARQTISLFNLLRPYMSLKLGLRDPRFWANTVDSLVVDADGVLLSGICSPHLHY